VALAPTAALTSGSYYGAIQDLATGCERVPFDLLVINVTDPGTPKQIIRPRILFGEQSSSRHSGKRVCCLVYSISAGVALAPTAALTSGSYGATRFGHRM
jgi:hypothetical protein